MTGRDPAGEIDHRDGNPFNNAWDNLRQATHSQNQCNRGVPANNKSGFKGVNQIQLKNSKKWWASIECEGKDYYLGCYTTPEAAASAYCEAAARLHGDFARTVSMPRPGSK
jgi:hypothetical protein